MALLCARKGDSERACYRWLARDERPLFPGLPAPAPVPAVRAVRRASGLFAAHQGWTARVLAPPPVLGGADSYGGALLHPYREKRHPLPDRRGRQGLSNHRWIGGGQLAVVLNKGGLICAWDAATATATATATVHDSAFQPLVAPCAEDMGVLADGNGARKEGSPPHLKVCPRGTWNDRMLRATTFSMLTLLCQAKHAIHRAWRYVTMRLAAPVALFTVLVVGPMGRPPA